MHEINVFAAGFLFSYMVGLLCVDREGIGKTSVRLFLMALPAAYLISCVVR